MVPAEMRLIVATVVRTRAAKSVCDMPDFSR